MNDYEKIKKHMKLLQENVDPRQLIPSLTEFLNIYDKEQISLKITNKGNMEAVDYLFVDVLRRKKQGWFMVVMAALCELGQEHIVLEVAGQSILDQVRPWRQGDSEEEGAVGPRNVDHGDADRPRTESTTQLHTVNININPSNLRDPNLPDNPPQDISYEVVDTSLPGQPEIQLSSLPFEPSTQLPAEPRGQLPSLPLEHRGQLPSLPFVHRGQLPFITAEPGNQLPFMPEDPTGQPPPESTGTHQLFQSELRQPQQTTGAAGVTGRQPVDSGAGQTVLSPPVQETSAPGQGRVQLTAGMYGPGCDPLWPRGTNTLEDPHVTTKPDLIDARKARGYAHQVETERRCVQTFPKQTSGADLVVGIGGTSLSRCDSTLQHIESLDSDAAETDNDATETDSDATETDSDATETKAVWTIQGSTRSTTAQDIGLERCISPAADEQIPQADDQVSLPDTDRQVSLPDTDRQVSLPYTDRQVSLPDTDRHASLPGTYRHVSLSDTDGHVSLPDPDRHVSLPDPDRHVSLVPDIGRRVSLSDIDGRVSLSDTDGHASLSDTDGHMSLPDTDRHVSLSDTDRHVSLPDTDRHVSLPDTDRRVSLSDIGRRVSLSDIDGHASLLDTDGHTSLSDTDIHVSLPDPDGHVSLSDTDGHASLSDTDGHVSLPDTDRHVSLPDPDGHASLSDTDGHASLSHTDRQNAHVERCTPTNMPATPQTERSRVANLAITALNVSCMVYQNHW